MATSVPLISKAGLGSEQAYYVNEATTGTGQGMIKYGHQIKSGGPDLASM